METIVSITKGGKKCKQRRRALSNPVSGTLHRCNETGNTTKDLIQKSNCSFCSNYHISTMDLSSSSSSSSSVSSTAYSNFGGTDDEKVGGITNGTGVMRGSTPVGTAPIGSAATTIPLTTTATATAEPSVSTSDFASLISSSGANTTSSNAYNNSNSSNSTCCISSINHVPESAARWIVAQLVEQAKSISTQSHTFQLETLFVHHANICPPTATTKQESARLFIESIIHRFSRQDRHRDGLACLKCK